MAKKWGITLDGFNDLIARLDDLDGNVKKAVNNCLEASQEIISKKLEKDMKKLFVTKEGTSCKILETHF